MVKIGGNESGGARRKREELRASECEREALVGMIGNGKNAARQIVILRPQVEEWLLRGAANFPGESREGSDAPAILARISIAPSAVNSLRQACSSADRSTPGV
jgi:hypothetical protein